MALKTRSYAFTLFYKTRKDVVLLEEWLTENCRYAMFGEEVCPETGRPHLQGWCYFENERSWNALKKLGLGWHVEPTDKSFEANEKYCRGLTKGKTPNEVVWVHGEFPAQGKRTDLIAIRDRILNGERVNEMVMEMPDTYHIYGRTMREMEDIAMQQVWRTEMTECLWLVGVTGAGKSHFALHDYTNETHYIWKNDNGWQDGYRQQPIVVMNDFRGELPYNEFLQLVDKWPYHVRRRNRPPMPFTSKKVIVTSSLPPERVYRNRDAEDGIAQLLRRVKVVRLPPHLVTSAGAEVVPVILDTGTTPDADEGKRLKANFERALLELEKFLSE